MISGFMISGKFLFDGWRSFADYGSTLCVSLFWLLVDCF